VSTWDERDGGYRVVIHVMYLLLKERERVVYMIYKASPLIESGSVLRDEYIVHNAKPQPAAT